MLVIQKDKMTNILRAFLASATVLLTVTDASATSFRNHYIVAHRDRTPAYDVTYVYNSDESHITGTFLVADRQGPLLRVDIVSDYTNRQNVSKYALLRGSKKTLKIVQHLPFTSTTMTSRREELKSRPDIDNLAIPVTVEVSTPGVSRNATIRGLDSDWNTRSSAGDQRAKVKEAMGSEMYPVLAALRELAGLPMFADLNTSLSYVFGQEALVRQSRTLMVAKEKQNCAFDARFGVPCTASSKR